MGGHKPDGAMALGGITGHGFGSSSSVVAPMAGGGAGAGTAAKGLIVSPVTHGRRKGNARLSVSASTPDLGPAAVAPPSALSPHNEERAKLAREGASILGAVLPVGNAGRRKSSAGSGHIDFGAAPQHKPVAGRRAQQK